MSSSGINQNYENIGTKGQQTLITLLTLTHFIANAAIFNPANIKKPPDILVT